MLPNIWFNFAHLLGEDCDAKEAKINSEEGSETLHPYSCQWHIRSWEKIVSRENGEGHAKSGAQFGILDSLGEMAPTTSQKRPGKRS